MLINKTIYSCMNDSQIYDTDGLPYPDLLTGNLDNFKSSSSVVYVKMEQRYIDRFDLMMYYYYDTSEYDDFVLFYNQKYRNDLVVGDELKLPLRSEIDAFIIANRKE